MSSTSRGSLRSEYDYYTTPHYAIHEFIECAKSNTNIFSEMESKKILDPCAGGSPSSVMSYPECLSKYGAKVFTVDIRDDSLANQKGDYLKLNAKGAFDMIITNPPFNISMEVIQKAILDVKDGGIVIMLLRLNYFGSKARREFFDKNMPNYAFVHSKRMSFSNNGKTDSIEYMHSVWIKGGSTNFTKLYLI